MTTPKSHPGKKSFFNSFNITDRESCAAAIKNGGIAAMISAGITAVFAVAGFFSRAPGTDLGYLLDPWLLVDVVLILILGFFIFRKSRIAATVMLVYFVTGKVFMWIELGAPKGLVLTVIFLLYYFTAMRGTYLWHSKYRLPPVLTAEPVSK